MTETTVVTSTKKKKARKKKHVNLHFKTGLTEI